MNKAVKADAARQKASKSNSTGQELVNEIEKLKAAATKAQGVVDRSHDALHMVLANCLALTSTFGKDCPEFKRSLRNKEGLHEYREDAPGKAPSPFKPVIWQVFKNPPRQTLYRYTSVLTLIETEAGDRNISLLDKKAIVALMKAHRSIDRMVGLVKKTREPNPIDPAARHAEWAAKIRKAEATLEKRDVVARVDPETTKVQAEGTFSLFAGTWTKDRKIEIVSLDAVGNPADQEIVDIWSAQQKELRDAVDIPTAFLADLSKLAKAIKEPQRPRDDQDISRKHLRRIRFDPQKNCTVAKVGLVGNAQHPSLIAKTQQFSFPLSSSACVYRTPSENHEERLFDCVNRDIRNLTNVVRVEGRARDEEDVSQGIVGRLLFGNEDDPTEIVLVDPQNLPGKHKFGKEQHWDFSCNLDRATLAGLKACLEDFRNRWKASIKSRGRKKGKSNGQADPAKQGFPISFDVSDDGLLVRGLNGIDGCPVSGTKAETGKSSSFELSFRSDDLLACIRAALKVKGVGEAHLHLSQGRSCKLQLLGDYGEYSYYLPAAAAPQ